MEGKLDVVIVIVPGIVCESAKKTDSSAEVEVIDEDEGEEEVGGGGEKIEFFCSAIPDVPRVTTTVCTELYPLTPRGRESVGETGCLVVIYEFFCF